jgi:hypothetical protein
MNIEDRKRFSRYYPGYIELPEELEILDNEKNQENEDKDITKKNILGYIDKINIDKDKLVMDTIMDSNANSNP